MTVSVKINCFHCEEEELQRLLKTFPKSFNVKIIKRYKDDNDRYQSNRDKLLEYQKKYYEKKHVRKYARFYIVTSPEGKVSKMSLKEMSKFFGYDKSYMLNKLKKEKTCFGYTIEKCV